MANRFFDVTASGGLNTGGSTDDAFTSLTSMKSGMSAGDRLYIRRTMLEVVASDFDLTNDGTDSNPIIVTCWPRAGKTTTGDFTQGSTTVTNIASADMANYADNMRFITGPDGNTYWIESITSTTEVELQKDYIGADSTGGSFTIEEDDYYDESRLIDDSAWTTKLSTWDADSDVVPGWDMNNASVDFNMASDNYWHFHNLRWINGGAKTPWQLGTFGSMFKSCFLTQGDSSPTMTGTVTGVLFILVRFKGAGGSNRIGFTSDTVFRSCSMKDLQPTYIFLGTRPGTQQRPFCEDCNFSVVSAGTYRIAVGDEVIFKDCMFQGDVLEPANVGFNNRCSVENYNRIRGDNRVYLSGVGAIVSNDGSGADVDLRATGATIIQDILMDGSSSRVGIRTVSDKISSERLAPLIFEHRIWQTADSSKTYRYYVQSVTDALTSGEMWLEIENTYGHIYKSSNSIVARTGTGDWTNYIEATCTQPIDDWITLRVFVAKYSATSHRYIDPQVEISGTDGTVTSYFSNGESVAGYGIQTLTPSTGGGTKSRFGEVLGIKKGIY